MAFCLFLTNGACSALDLFANVLGAVVDALPVASDFGLAMPIDLLSLATCSLIAFLVGHGISSLSSIDCQ